MDILVTKTWCDIAGRKSNLPATRLSKKSASDQCVAGSIPAGRTILLIKGEDMKVLHLTLKKKWFDMIASGEKREEYREIKPYWNKRLNKQYDVISFRNGYSKDAPKMTVELKEISRGKGVVVWGAPVFEPVYILKLGNILAAPYK